MSDKDDDLLKQAEKRLGICRTAENDNFNDARSDLKFLKGEHWPEDSKRQRTIEKRPCLTINKHPAFLRQITNDQRQNRPSIHVHPVDDAADPKLSEVLEGMIRHIEYASNADICYDTSVHSAAAVGFGYFRLITDYEAPDSFDQVIKFDRIRNVFSVHIDPSTKNPDGSDMQYCFVETSMSRRELKRDYPKAESVQTAINDDDEDKLVLVLEYYSIEETPDTLLKLTNGEVGFKSDLIELPEGVLVLQERPSFKRKVMWRKMAGFDDKVPGKANPIKYEPRLLDVLDETEIPCSYIPVFLVIGTEVDIDGKVTYSGIIRDSKDSAMMYDFWMTSATEEVSMRPKTPYIGAEGQFAGHEEEWRQANVRTFSYLEYKPKTVNGVLAPPPARQPMADVPQGVLQMAMHASDEIKAVTGIYDASLGARGNETSGLAINSRKKQGDLSNFHYIDNLSRTVRHAGRCLVNMIPKVYSGPRIVRVIGKDDKVGHAKINQPGTPELTQDDQGTIQAVQQVINDVTVGKYDVTVQAGPSFSTLRDESRSAMMELSGNWPKLMDVAGDEVVKSMDWPGAQTIADRIRKTIPPEFLAEDGQGQDLPPEVKQMMDQAAQHIQELEKQLQEAASGERVEVIKAKKDIEIARMNNSSKMDVEELKSWIALQLQAMQPPPALTADVQQDIQENDTASSAGQQGNQAQ